MCVGVFRVAIYATACRGGGPVVESLHDASYPGVFLHGYLLMSSFCYCFNIPLETKVVHITLVVAVVEQVEELVVLTLALGGTWHYRANSPLPLFQ